MVSLLCEFSCEQWGRSYMRNILNKHCRKIVSVLNEQSGVSLTLISQKMICYTQSMKMVFLLCEFSCDLWGFLCVWNILNKYHKKMVQPRMNVHVSFCISFPRKWFVAHRTRKWFLSSVSNYVSSKGFFEFETFGTKITGKLFQSRMNVHMSFCTWFKEKWFVTHWAREWFLSCVSYFMTCKVSFTYKAFQANVAGKWFNSRVNFHVSVYARFFCKWFVTCRTRKWFISRVRFHMTGEVTLWWETFRTAIAWEFLYRIRCGMDLAVTL